MACPTCDHTMHGIGGWFWCPRCGTLKGNSAHGEVIEQPKLINRVVALCGFFDADRDAHHIERAHQLGITEAVTLSE